MTTKYTHVYGDAMLFSFSKGHWNIVMLKKEATAVPGRKVSVTMAMVFIAALSCLVSSATCAVAAAISRLAHKKESMVSPEVSIHLRLLLT